jgi:hypothetical protein
MLGRNICPEPNRRATFQSQNRELSPPKVDNIHTIYQQFKLVKYTHQKTTA